MVAIGRSTDDDSAFLYTWGSADGLVWDELHPSQSMNLPVNAETGELFLVGDDGCQVMGLNYFTPFHGAALVWTSTDGRA
jgi:hypothetical protein